MPRVAVFADNYRLDEGEVGQEIKLNTPIGIINFPFWNATPLDTVSVCSKW
jgi:hypothetical protein